MFSSHRFLHEISKESNGSETNVVKRMEIPQLEQGGFYIRGQSKEQPCLELLNTSVPQQRN